MCPSPGYLRPVLQADLSRTSKQYNWNVSHQKLWVSSVCEEISPVWVPESESPIRSPQEQWSHLKPHPQRPKSVWQMTNDRISDTQGWHQLGPSTKVCRRANRCLHQAEVGTQWLQSSWKDPVLTGDPRHILQKPAFFLQNAGRKASAPRGLTITAVPWTPALKST